MSSKSLLYIACAGSGKTELLVNQAFTESKTKKVLITTFTNSNTEEIRRRFTFRFGFIPNNITILSWYSFEIDHLIRPYRPSCIIHDITGVSMITNPSYFYKRGTEGYFLDQEGRIFENRIGDLSLFSINSSSGKVIQRMKRLWDIVFIDEDQDLSSHDFEVVGAFLSSGIETRLFGDPRQKTFSTDCSKKNCSWQTIDQYLTFHLPKLVTIDKTTLLDSFRCPSTIIEYASLIFPEYPVSHSKSDGKGDLFFVHESQIFSFLQSNKGCVQLRYNFTTKPLVLSGFEAMNIGYSKGLTFSHVLLFLPKTMLKALISNNFSLIEAPKTKSELYVAMTRTKGNCGIVVSSGSQNLEANPKIQQWIS